MIYLIPDRIKGEKEPVFLAKLPKFAESVESVEIICPECSLFGNRGFQQIRKAKYFKALSLSLVIYIYEKISRPE